MEVRIQSDGGATRVWLDGVEVTKRLRIVEFKHDEVNKRPICRVMMNRVDEDGAFITEKGERLTEIFEPWEDSTIPAKAEKETATNGQKGTGQKTNA